MHRPSLLFLLMGCADPPSTLLVSTHAVLSAVLPAPDTASPPVELDPAPADACELSHNLASPHLWEGDEVTFRVWCGGHVKDGDYDVDVLLPGADTVLDPEGHFSWRTNGRDGGHHRLTLVATPSAAGTLETRLVDIWIADNPAAIEAVPPDPRTYEEEWGLPVVHIGHDSALTVEDQPGTFTVRGEQVTGEVKLRGATSLAYPKNSFTLDFDSDELSVDEWGDRSRGHMVLTSTFDDNSYMRQKLTFDVWAEMAAQADERRLAPRTFFAVVYRNGVYEGLYLASDRVDDELARHMGFGGEGDLFKAIDHNANYGLYDDDGERKSDLAMGWEKKEGVDEADLSGVRALTEWAGMASNRGFSSEHEHWLQLGSFIDWQLIAMAANTEDSVGKNAYVYRIDEDGRYSVVPWDFNASWGQNWKTKRRDADSMRDFTEDNRIFWLVEEDPNTCAALVARHEALRAEGGPLDPNWQLARLADHEALIRDAALRDEARWGEEHRSFWRWADDRDEDADWTDFPGELAYMRAWIPARALVLHSWVEARCGGGLMIPHIFERARPAGTMTCLPGRFG